MEDVLQGEMKAVSRVLPRDQLPRRDPSRESSNLPLYEEGSVAAPPFLVQTPDADYCIAQLDISGHVPAPQPHRHVHILSKAVVIC